jgi:LysM repeat protein
MLKSGRFLAAAAIAAVLPLTLIGMASANSRHVVTPGDTLSYLAGVYVVTVGEIVEMNSIPDPNMIFPGQELLIPGRGGEADTASSAGTRNGSYTVVAGDTLSGIAAQFGLSTNELHAANPIPDPRLIYPGQVLVIPGVGTAAPAAEGPVPALHFPSKPYDPYVEALIEEFSAAYGVDPRLVKALATVESAWNQSAVSSAGAMGVMQIMPGTAAWLEADYFGGELYEETSVYDNIKMGVKLLQILLGETGGSEREAVASYYQGLSPTQQGVYYPDTQNYVATIFAVRLAYWP